MKVCELQGKALDYYVGKAHGWYLEYIMEAHPNVDGFGRYLPGGGDVYLRSARPVWHHSNGAVVSLPGWFRLTEADWKPSANWTQGGTIIERERISLSAPELSRRCWTATIRGVGSTDGDTPLQAAMRMYLAKVFGNAVPDEVEAEAT